MIRSLTLFLSLWFWQAKCAPSQSDHSLIESGQTISDALRPVHVQAPDAPVIEVARSIPLRHVVVVVLDATANEFIDDPDVDEFQPLKDWAQASGYHRVDRYFNAKTWTAEAVVTMVSGRNPEFFRGYYNNSGSTLTYQLPPEVPSIFTILVNADWLVQYSTQNPNAGLTYNAVQGVPEEFYNALAPLQEIGGAEQPLWYQTDTREQFHVAANQLLEWKGTNPDNSTMTWIHTLALHDPLSPTIMDPTCVKDVQETALGCSYDLVSEETRTAAMSEYSFLNEQDAEACSATYKTAERCIARAFVADLVDGLTELQTAEALGPDTLLIITNDHGECTGDQAASGKGLDSDELSRQTRCWEHYQPQLVDDQLLGSLWMGWDDMKEEDLTIHGPVSQVDIAPTIVDLLDVDLSATTAWTSFDGQPMTTVSDDQDVMSSYYREGFLIPSVRMTTGDGAYALAGSVETGRFVYTNRETDPEFLVNMEDDPSTWTSAEQKIHERLLTKIYAATDAFTAVNGS